MNGYKKLTSQAQGLLIMTDNCSQTCNFLNLYYVPGHIVLRILQVSFRLMTQAQYKEKSRHHARFVHEKTQPQQSHADQLADTPTAEKTQPRRMFSVRFL